MMPTLDTEMGRQPQVVRQWPWSKKKYEESGWLSDHLGPGLLGTDVFLAAVYGVYMQTVLRMRMTKEFTNILPPLPDLIRRLLGVHHAHNRKA